MFEELVSLTQKERNEIFSHKSFRKGDFVSIPSSRDVGRIEYLDRKNKICLIRTIEGVQTYQGGAELSTLSRVTAENFNTLRRNWLERRLVPETSHGRYKLLHKILSSIYPEERFDIKLENASKFTIIVHYPEIEIRNSLGLSHTIRDLYFSVLVRMSGTDIFVRNFALARTTFEEREYNGSNFYVFSHTRSRDDAMYLLDRGFCFGQTNLSAFVGKLSSEGGSIFELKKFFFSMNNYFSWESLEGTPYHKISNIGTNMYSSVDIDISSYREIIEKKADEVMERMEDFTFTFGYNELFNDLEFNITNVNRHSSLDEFIRQNINEEDIPEELKCYIVNGNYVRNFVPIYRERLKSMRMGTNIVFKDTSPKLKIIYQDLPENPQKVVHFSVYQEIARIIGIRFKTYLILNDENS